MTTTISFGETDDVTVIRAGKVIYPSTAEVFAKDAVPCVKNSLEIFGQTWKRNASDYEAAICELEGGGMRFILRHGDMRAGSDTSSNRERSELSGSGFAGEASGIYDFDFKVTIQAYDDASGWSSLVQVITDDTDPNMAYQPLLKLQSRPSEERITLNSYLPEFSELGSIPLIKIGQPVIGRLTVDFDSGYVRWAMNGETLHSGQIDGLKLAGTTAAKIYPKIGAYRQGPVLGTAVNDFQDVSFMRRN